jgi:lipopolysaccharide exporter
MRLNQTIRAGIGWTTGSRLFGLFLQVASSTVVSRHLSPGDIGVLGFANIFVGFLGRFTSFGIDAAIVQRKQVDDKVLATAFTLQSALGIAAFVAALMIAPVGQVLIGHAGAAHILMVLGTVFLLNVLAFVPTTRFTRELEYGRLSFAYACRALGRGVLVIGLVWLGFGYWGVVVAEVVATMVLLASLGRTYPWIVRPRFDEGTARALLGFAGPILASNLVVFILFNADNFAIGSLLGATMLGYYAVAFNWGSMICGILYETVNNVLFPAFSKIQDSVADMKRLYLKTVERVGFVAVLVNTCLLASAHDFLVVVQGRGSDKWLPAVTCLQILAVYGMLRALTEPLANVMLTLRKTKTLLKANVVGAVIEIALIVPALLGFGINGVAILVLIAYAAQLWVCGPVLARDLSVRARELVQIVVPLAIASAVSVYVSFAAVPQAVETSWLSFGLRIFVTIAALILVHGALTSFRMLREALDVAGWILREAREA